jgi:octaprenyl-diphosphate synthase
MLLALAKDDGLRRKLRDAWAFSSISPERAQELGAGIIATGAVDQSLERLNVEIVAALDRLGPFANTAGGHELVSWAHKLSAGITDQVRSRVA